MDQQTQKNLLAIVKRNYQEIAEVFNQTRKKPAWPEIVKLADLVEDGDKILDAGCGNGRFLQLFDNKRINYIGIDSSVDLIERARKNLQTKNFEGKFQDSSSRFQVLDILALEELPEKDFDYIFCIAVLHHLPGAASRLKFLKQMKNKIKPTGKIIITVWNLWSRAKFRKLILKNFWQKIRGRSKLDFGDILFDWNNSQGECVSQRYYHAFNQYGLKKLFKSTGLKVEKNYQDKYNYYAILKK